MKLESNKLVTYASSAAASLNALTVRERVLIIATLITFMVALWYLLVVEPLAREAADARLKIETLQEQLFETNDTLEEQVLRLAGNGTEQRLAIDALSEEIDRLNDSLGSLNRELVPPADVAVILESMLANQRGLNLISLEHLPAEALSVGDEEDAPVFYRHGVELELTGSFDDCRNYLSAVEQLPWRLYWQFVDIRGEDYPQNRIRLRVSTLSLSEEWIGA